MRRIEGSGSVMRTVTAALVALAGAMSAAAAESPVPFPMLPLPPEAEGLAILSEMRPKGRGNYLDLIRREAQRQGVPAPIADAVAGIESGYDPGAMGAVGEVGLMQVRPETAGMLGHTGTLAELFNPETNVRYGVTYLAGAWRLAGGDLCLALAKYRAGHGQTRISPRSADYCLRARAHLAGLGIPVTPSTGLATEGLAGRAASRRQQAAPALARAVANLSVVRRLWAEHAARTRQIEARISRIMSGD